MKAKKNEKKKKRKEKENMRRKRSQYHTNGYRRYRSTVHQKKNIGQLVRFEFSWKKHAWAVEGKLLSPDKSK